MNLTSRSPSRLLLAVAVAASVLTPSAPAQAASVLEPFTANFALTRVTPDTSSLITAVENNGVTTGSVTDVLSPGLAGTPGLCHTPNGLNGAFIPDGFCWDDVDDRSDYSDEDGGWMPQGFSTADGAYAGRSLTVTSWYFGTYVPGRNPTTIEEYSRITIAESTGSGVRYGHVALVEPTAGGNFKNLTNRSHADGVAWYGDRLFVANGAELQVFDLRHLWRMTDPAGAGTGITGGKSSARSHRWALPLVARYSTISSATVDNPSTAFRNDNPRACGPAQGDELCLSTLSLDRSSSGPELVSAENRNGAGGRVVRWPLTTLGAGTPSRTVASGTGYISPVWNIQGIATDGTDYYMSGICPDSWPDSGSYSCIHAAAGGQAPHVLTQSPWLSQGLSWDPRAGRLWGVNEALVKNNQGRRMVFTVDPSKGATSGGWSWLTNFNKAGAVCATPQGNGLTNGTPITVWPCTGGEIQRWKYQDGMIVHKSSGKCVTPEANGANVNGAVLTLWTCNAASDVQRFSAGGDGYAVNSYGKAITPKGDSFGDGVWLTLWTKASPAAASQQWVVKGF